MSNFNPISMGKPCLYSLSHSSISLSLSPQPAPCHPGPQLQAPPLRLSCERHLRPAQHNSRRLSILLSEPRANTVVRLHIRCSHLAAAGISRSSITTTGIRRASAIEFAPPDPHRRRSHHREDLQIHRLPRRVPRRRSAVLQRQN